MQPRKKNLAFSLLEVVLGMVVVGMLLVPTAAMMNDVMAGQGVQRYRIEMNHLALGKLSEYSMLSRAKFQSRRDRGNFRTQGYPEIAYKISCSQTTSSGGIPGRLLSITVDAWHDVNQNSGQDAGEASIRLWTAVARANR